MLGSDSRAQIFLCVKFDTLENVSILTRCVLSTAKSFHSITLFAFVILEYAQVAAKSFVCAFAVRE